MDAYKDGGFRDVGRDEAREGEERVHEALVCRIFQQPVTARGDHHWVYDQRDLAVLEHARDHLNDFLIEEHASLSIVHGHSS